ncbi:MULTISPECIES: bifunctional (p)ppGpp synthetase/guanosine-3',5'-bis(diphosphate) 3'-pyrophosphohydrolase [Methylovorus]|jgi:GTP diphosphokinase / guanosine-3',5'-bis(diphosphate) 3'-diphosphatase|uniref:(P)ppGpp synthetase I, SpoT/RelA n=1 Tax=Methylovorus glucosotrophus (strain SIP3-4) TaxID=582744 RepID=C6X832_METGS|nr:MULTISPECIES: bifunctional (p)ppGpp synthetase/guanosine-3',5'-bis(diphosphate) 3'-pyrophosphohydrolase [Methylovorus]ACT49302.1 (p)ppGpp synthetase I, SpoT/RelA [Methylovorus glucosotrophus SIP3-4]ADQ83252.1 (p)ppGpp synthetase I, SpoT/RelA [Methylovorus sp. MP688]KAF0842608.1 GTP pyrophosphokinase [Methylovorus glucosotrophus]
MPKLVAKRPAESLKHVAAPLLPADSEDSLLTQRLRVYLKPEDIEQVWAAYRFSDMAHTGQLRKSGEPYITHPVSVACILAELHMDVPTLVAALLHDVVEDTGVTTQEVSERFGKQVAELVDGLSKLDKIKFSTETEAQAENFRKMLLAMSQDVRVILVKLADRLHNMSTLGVMTPEKRRRTARETLEIYAPIANRLGLNAIYQELEDLSFKHLYPMRYSVISKAILAARGNRKEVVGKILDAIRERLGEMHIEAEVTGREKHLYSIYRKMTGKTVTFSQIYDIYGFRIIVKDLSSCYLALGVLHGLYKPIPGKFKDYIAIPKANGYQSLHTTLFGPFGTPIEVQIRSREMHNIADAGVAAHWLYKTTDAHLTELQQQTHQWLQRLLDIQSESTDSLEFLEHFKVDLFPDEVYVFTPKGKIMALPKGATAVDFAYAVHTDIGNRCVAVKINQELAPLRTELHNGDHVEIITAAHAHPNPAWLNYVATGKARAHIRHFLKSLQTTESAHLGERLLNQALRALHADVAKIDDTHWQKLLRDYGAKNKEEILTDIGLGKRLNVMVAHQLLAMSEEQGERHAKHTNKPLGTITIRGSEGMAVQFAQCCRPIPGDPILGFINKDKGLVIHTHDCPAIRKFRVDPEKWLDVEWDPDGKRLFNVNLKLVVANQRGMLAQIASTIAEAGSNIDHVSMEESDSSAYTNMHFTVQVENRVHLAELMRRIRKIPDVVRINRVKGAGTEQRIQ